MNLKLYNDLCAQWHREVTGKRLGQWLMDHLPEVEDREIFYKQDKREASTLFFNRYVVTSLNGPANSLSRANFISFQPY